MNWSSELEQWIGHLISIQLKMHDELSDPYRHNAHKLSDAIRDWMLNWAMHELNWRCILNWIEIELGDELESAWIGSELERWIEQWIGDWNWIEDWIEYWIEQWIGGACSIERWIEHWILSDAIGDAYWIERWIGDWIERWI